MRNLVPIVLFISIALTLFGIFYIRSRENMALIERGINPRQGQGPLRPFASLKYGLLLIGAGIGLALAFMIDSGLHHPANASVNNVPDVTPVYFALIGIGGGLGLVVSYLIEYRALRRSTQGKQEQQLVATDL